MKSPVLKALDDSEIRRWTQLLCCSVVGLCVPAHAQSTATTDGAPIPLTTARPHLSPGLCALNTEGWVDVAFTVLENGTVADAHVLAAEPRNTFEDSAIGSVVAWTYAPRYNTVEVRQRLTFKTSELCAALASAATATPASASSPAQTVYNTMQQLISSEVRYPPKAVRRGEQGIARVNVMFKRDGTITGVRLVQSAGFSELDDEAIDVFHRLGHFPPIPERLGAAGETFVVDLPISFELRK